jgi:hypothetical protein
MHHPMPMHRLVLSAILAHPHIATTHIAFVNPLILTQALTFSSARIQ